MPYFTDNPNFHLREVILLNQALVDQIAGRGGGAGPLVLVARRITLAGAVVTDRDVVLIAEILDGTHPAPTISLVRSGHGPDGVLAQEGQIAPPIEVIANPKPGPGAKGHSLRVYCKELRGGSGTSRGQTGGTGVKGKVEIRNACSLGPPGAPSICNGMTPEELSDLDGPPGGKGLPGGEGGPGGDVTVACITNSSGVTSGWLGLGGLGGEGGPGGHGGAGGNKDAPHGPLGPKGDDGPKGEDKPRDVRVIAASDWYAEVRGVLVTGPEATDVRVADLWAEFQRRQAARDIRARQVDHAHQTLRSAAALSAETPQSLDLAKLVRFHRDHLGVERDLDIEAAVRHYEQEWATRRAKLAEAIAPLLPLPNVGDPNLLQLGPLTAAARSARAKVAELVATETSFVDQRARATERATAARDARRAAYRRCRAATSRAQVLAGTVALPPGFPLTGPAVANLAATLNGLVPRNTADETDQDAADPIDDTATLLPAAIELLVNRNTRDTGGGFGQYPPPVFDIRAAATKYPLTTYEQWPGVHNNDSTVVIDLAEVGEELRGHLRATPTGPPAPLLTELLDLVEAVYAWRLANLRMQQARECVETIALLEATVAALPDIPAAPTSVGALLPLALRVIRCLLDLVHWHGRRAERAYALYSIELGPSLPLATGETVFIPALEAVLLDGAEPGSPAHSAAAAVARLFTATLELAATASTLDGLNAYRDRGDRVVDHIAERSFCRDAAGGCDVVSPHVFAALRDPLQSGFFFDVDLAEVKGPHREAKIRGAYVWITYDLTNTDFDPPATQFPVELTHGGLGRQDPLGQLVTHSEHGLPIAIPVTMKRQPESSVWMGRVEVESGNEVNLPAYGRGVAAGMRLQLSDAIGAAPDLMTKVSIEIVYEGLQPKGTVNLRRATLTSVTRPGLTAIGTVELTGAAPAEGLPVRLRSTDPATLKVPSQIVVPADSRSMSFPVEVLKPSTAIPPTLLVSSPDGVSRRLFAPVPAAPKPLTSSTTIGPDSAGSVYALAVATVPLPGSVAPRPVVFATRTAGETPADTAGNAVHIFDPDLTHRASVDTGFWPRSLAVDAQRARLYVVHGPTLSLIDTRTLKITAERLIGIGAAAVAVDPAAQLVYVTRQTHGTVHVLRGADLSPVTTIGDQATFAGAGSIAVDPISARIFVARSYRIAEPNIAAVSSIKRQPNGTHVIDRDVVVGDPLLQPSGIDIDRQSGLVFVSCLGGANVRPVLLVLSHSSLAVRSTVPLPSGSTAVAARPGTGIAYAVDSLGLKLIDGRTGRAALSIKAGAFPQGVAVDPVTGVAYVGDRLDHSLTRVAAPTDLSTTVWR